MDAAAESVKNMAKAASDAVQKAASDASSVAKSVQESASNAAQSSQSTVRELNEGAQRTTSGIWKMVDDFNENEIVKRTVLVVGGAADTAWMWCVDVFQGLTRSKN